MGSLPTELAEALDRLKGSLGSERPWQGVGTLAGEVALVRGSYQSCRADILAEEGTRVEEARARVKQQPGFATLSGEHTNQVLRPLHEAVYDTDAEAVEPTLVLLNATFPRRLQEAEELAIERLDELLDASRPVVTKVRLQLHNREIASEAELEALIDEIRGRLLEQLRAGARVRLV